MHERVHRAPVEKLRTQLKRYLTVLMSPTETNAAGLSTAEATQVLVAMHNEAIEIFRRHLCQYYVQSWNEYRVDAEAAGPASDGRIRQLCLIVKQEVRACVVKERVGLGCHLVEALYSTSAMVV